MARAKFQGCEQGRGGGGPGRGRRKLICYNYGGPGHYAHDCMNLMHPSCLYSTFFDHETEDCPTLIARIHDKGVFPPPPTQNLQMMRSELREEDPNVNIVLKSGIMTRDDKGK